MAARKKKARKKPVRSKKGTGAPPGLEKETGTARAQNVLEAAKADEAAQAAQANAADPTAPQTPQPPTELMQRAKLVEEGFGCYLEAFTKLMGDVEKGADPTVANVAKGVRCFAQACLLKYAEQLGPHIEEVGLGGGVVLLYWLKKQRDQKKKPVESRAVEPPKVTAGNGAAA